MYSIIARFSDAPYAAHEVDTYEWVCAVLPDGSRPSGACTMYETVAPYHYLLGIDTTQCCTTCGLNVLDSGEYGLLVLPNNTFRCYDCENDLHCAH